MLRMQAVKMNSLQAAEQPARWHPSASTADSLLFQGYVMCEFFHAYFQG
jgi:hypothetical protein